ncbi:hypothetical protein B0H14DRAFT_3672858 [Mycena olivaceomarginata]|nr:hypothetical protein B0H14DRAFT_3672858 [Mycena olivaceomarginata]
MLVWDHCGSAAGALDKGVVNAGPMKELSVADGWHCRVWEGGRKGWACGESATRRWMRDGCGGQNGKGGTGAEGRTGKAGRVGRENGKSGTGEEGRTGKAGRVRRTERGRGGAAVLAWRVQRGNVGVDRRGWCGERAVVEQAGAGRSGTSGGSVRQARVATWARACTRSGRHGYGKRGNALNELPVVRDPAADSTGERERHGTGPRNSVIPDRQSSIAAPGIDHNRSWVNSNRFSLKTHSSRRLLFWISLRAEALILEHRLVEVQHGTKTNESQFKSVKNWRNEIYICCEGYVDHKWRYCATKGMRQKWDSDTRPKHLE